MDDEKKSQEPAKVGVVGWLSIAFVLFFGVGGLLGFLKLLFEDGWSSASQRNPVGPILLFVALAIGYFFAILFVEKKNKDAARKMIWAAVAAGGIFLIALFPSCQNDGRTPTDMYYRR